MSARDLYREAIKALAAAGTGHGRLDAPDGRALLDNPLCGDRVEMEVKFAAGHIAALAHRVNGCLLCRAAAAVGQRAAGASAEEIERVAAQLTAMLEEQDPPPDGWTEFGAFAPVHGYRSRYGCVLLPVKTLLAALRAAGS